MPTDTATQPTTQVPRRRTDEILTSLADRVGGRFTAATVFGTPVQGDGVTVIPVASMRFGFGGGGGTGPGSGQSGEGGGGGGDGTPAGYIELKGASSRFVPVVHPARMAAMLCATAIAIAFVRRPR